MHLIKTNENFSRKIFSQTAQGYTEADIIVPDVKPDIVRILKADANAYVTGQTIQGEKVILDARADITVLYLAEGGNVRSILSNHTFKQVVDSKCMLDGAVIDAKLNVQNVESVVVNSRKFCVKLLLGVEAMASAKENIEFATGAENEDLQQHFTRINVCGKRLAGIGEFLIRDVLDVPPGKASIGEVLSVNTKINNHEVKAAGNKVLLKGEIGVNSLFLADDESVHCMEHELPFSEIVTMDGEIRDGAEVSAEFNLMNPNWNPQADSDGEVRLLGVDVSVGARIHIKENVELDALDDVYDTNGELELSTDTINIPNISMNEEIKLPISDSIATEAGLPEISQILDVNMRPKVNATRSENGKTIIDGVANCEVLYLSGNGDVPISNIKKEIPFTCEMNCPQTPTQTNVELTNVNHSLTSSGQVDLRAELTVNALCEGQQEYKFITNITEKEAEENAPANQPYCLRVYFVKDGDTAWSVAKRFKLKVKDLIEENGENLKPGQKLILEG